MMCPVRAIESTKDDDTIKSGREYVLYRLRVGPRNPCQEKIDEFV